VSGEILGVLGRLGLSVLPVLAFLVALEFLDSYKLVTYRRILRAVVAGGLVALVCYVINSQVFRLLGEYGVWYARIGAPILEELLKAVYVIYLVRKAEVGFMTDAAINGFAVGAGFALVENISYQQILAGSPLAVMVLRGFGTAMMHGGTTAIVGTVSSSLAGTRASRSAGVFLPGLAVAGVVHCAYNLALLPPVASAVAVLIGLPVIFSLIFLQSESSLRNWMGQKLDKDVQLLSMISTGRLSETHAGQYLQSLKNSFPPEMLGDMLCLLQLYLELSAQAKGDLIQRQFGFPVEPDPTVGAKFREIAYLEKSLGLAGRSAIAPLLSLSSRDLWEMHQLSRGAESKPASLLSRLWRVFR
jgi:RsiW-degrading membrane proteinase PrsW (M82 family)